MMNRLMNCRSGLVSVPVLCLVLLGCSAPALTDEPAPVAGSRYFRVHVVDEQTGRGVPMVELETVSDALFVTDSVGMAAIDEPALMGREAYFHVRSHGYEYPKDGFGFRGVRLKVEAGGSARVKIKRLNVAERLYRVTGEGIYRDSVLLGDTPPVRHPLLNGQVMGQDSCVNAIYRGKLYWFWGDTDRIGYPLGNYRTSGAVSDLPGRGGLDPSVGVDLEYFVNDKGFSREMFPHEGPGPVWVFGPMVLRDGEREILVTHFSRMESLGKRLEHGIGVWNDEKQIFEKRADFPLDAPLQPLGQPVEVVIDGERWFYFPQPYPVVRVRAKLEDVLDPTRYEAFTCYKPGTRTELDRGSDGKLIWAWKANTAPVKHARGLFEAGDGFDGTGPDGMFHLTDVETGKHIRTGGGSVFWNEYRAKWVMIALESFGKSMLGEVWYAEADTVLGPWVYARRIVTHDKYSFYNIKQHPYFDQEGGRYIYFEGTYTDFVSGAPRKTPRYDYNQVMYRLDLSDERLSLPAPVERDGKVEFYAIYSRPVVGASPPPADEPPFQGLPVDAPQNPALVALYMYRHDSGEVRYLIEDQTPDEGWKRQEEPAFMVWRSPRVDPPREPDTQPSIQPRGAKKR